MITSQNQVCDLDFSVIFFYSYCPMEILNSVWNCFGFGLYTVVICWILYMCDLLLFIGTITLPVQVKTRSYIIV